MNKWKCDVCGYVVEGDIPEVCPVCGAGSDVFVEATDEDLKNMKTWICLYCGYIYETEEVPQMCPECQVKGANVFVEYDESKNQFAEAGNMYRCNACALVQYADEAPGECPACGANTFTSREDWLKKRQGA